MHLLVVSSRARSRVSARGGWQNVHHTGQPSTGLFSVEVDLLHRPIPIDFASPDLVRGLML